MYGPRRSSQVHSERAGRRVEIRVPLRGQKHQFLELVEKNAQHSFMQRFRVLRPDSKAIAEALQEVLGLETAPRRIESFDISHIQGADTVASMVVWEDGRMKKSDYRKFIIRGETGNDDFASMREAVGRRYRRLQQEEKPLPDLILIDGGIGQLRAAASALEELGQTTQTVASIAKREEIIYLYGHEDEPIVLERRSPVLHLIQRIRDESHRFAITYHRKLRAKAQTRSVLDELPGVKVLDDSDDYEAAAKRRKPPVVMVTGRLQRAVHVEEPEHQHGQPVRRAVSLHVPLAGQFAGRVRAARSRRLVLELLASSVDLSTTPLAAAWIEGYGADADRFGDDSATVDQPVKDDNELYVRDYAKCILCYKCVEACGEDAQNTFAISVAGRGFDARISTEWDVGLPDSACVYCGNCIGVCPTGALMFSREHAMRAQGTWDEAAQSETDTICPYCGVGCTLTLRVQDERIVRVTSPLDQSVTGGHLCVKGRFGWAFMEGEAAEGEAGT